MISFRSSVIAVVAAVVAVSNVAAEVTPLTPDVAERARAMAEKARTEHATSPNDASSAFMSEFNGDFGDIVPVDLRVVDQPALSVQVLTPLMMLRNVLLAALRTLAPLPTVDELVKMRTVIVKVQPKQRGAPDISRVVLFRGDKQINAVKSSLAPQSFKTGFGVEFTINAGAVEFPDDALRPGSDIRIVLLSGASPIEWKLSAADVANVR